MAEEDRNLGPQDVALLSLLQQAVPLVRDPWGQLAASLGETRQAVCRRVDALRAAGVVREISGIFDAVALGYRQSLVSFSVAGDQLDSAGRCVAAHPGVSHCYGRENRWNLWFTLAASPDSTLGLEGTVEALAREVGATGHMILPTLERFKLAVQFDFDRPGQLRSGKADTGASRPGKAASATLSAAHRRAIRALQQDLPTDQAPFDTIAAREGLTGESLLASAADFLATGWLRRYAAVVRHQAAGADANVMVVWRVDAADSQAGRVAAACDAVSHCYFRPTFPDWPFGLYTMVHGPSVAACETTITRLADDLNRRAADDHQALWTTTEFKKKRIRLLTDHESQWEQACRCLER